MVDVASQHAEGHGNKAPLLENSSINKSEPPDPSSDKSTCASYAAVEGAKTQDYPYPQPIPEGKSSTLPACTGQICWTEHICCPDSSRIRRGDCQSGSFAMLQKLKTQTRSNLCVSAEMLHGWWRVSDVENLHSLIKTLHSRGVREKALQKQIQKHMEHVSQLGENCKDGGFHTLFYLSVRSGTSEMSLKNFKKL